MILKIFPRQYIVIQLWLKAVFYVLSCLFRYLLKQKEGPDNEIMILKIVETIFLVSMTSSLEKEYLKVMENKMVLSDTHCDIKS